jgi:hypothetical protein
LIERNGVLQDINGINTEHIYGTNYRTGEFIGYRRVCGTVDLSSRNGMSLFIVKPDPTKGTNEWVEGAKPVKLNGLDWLFKEIPPREMTASERGFAAPIEIWVLKISGTPYWMMLEFFANLKHSIQDHPEQHLEMLNLFHKIVASVKLEPLVLSAEEKAAYSRMMEEVDRQRERTAQGNREADNKMRVYEEEQRRKKQLDEECKGWVLNKPQCWNRR